MMHRQPPLPPGTGLCLLVAVGALLHPPELLRPMLNRHLGQRVEPLAGVRSAPPASQVVQEIDEAAPGNVRVCSFSGEGKNIGLYITQSFPLRRAGWRILCSVLFLSLLATEKNAPVVPTFSKKEQFPFPPGFQVRGPTVCDASSFSPMTHLASAVWGCSASPRTSSQFKCLKACTHNLAIQDQF